MKLPIGKVIDVDEVCIRKGIPRNNTKCAIANALNKFVGEYECYIVANGIYAEDKEGIRTKVVNFPDSIYRFILDFDNNRKVTPFKFMILNQDGQLNALLVVEEKLCQKNDDSPEHPVILPAVLSTPMMGELVGANI